jgi:hypothetical protein
MVVISAINQFPNPAAAAAAASFLARFVMTAFFAAREEDFGLLGFLVLPRRTIVSVGIVIVISVKTGPTYTDFTLPPLIKALAFGILILPSEPKSC